MYKLSVKFNKLDESPVELMIYQDIGDDPFSESQGFTANDFRNALKDIPPTRALDVRINSAGGSVWDGLAIKTLLDEWKGRKTASIDGMAASVASWLPLSCDEIRAPRHAQMFIHDAWGMCMGNAADMKAQAADLDKTSDQIAGMYHRKAGGTVSEWRDRMKSNSLFTAEEANKLGLIDRLTNDEPVSNFSAIQIRNMKAKLATLNQLKSSADGGHNQEKNNMNRKQKIALLNKWGVSTSKNATDEFLDQMINAMKVLPQNMPKFENGKDGAHIALCKCSECGGKNAPEPSEETPDADAEGGAKTAGESAEFKAATANSIRLQKQVNQLLLNQRRGALQASFDLLVTEGKVEGNAVKEWMNMAMSAEDAEDGSNPIIKQLNTMPARLPGREPVNIVVGDSDSIEDLNKNIEKLSKIQEGATRNCRTLMERQEIGARSSQISQLVNRFKTYDKKTGELTGPIRAMWDKFVSSPQNANVMSSQLLRQVIMSEVMRAFRRQFTSLSYFSHNFGNVPLQGTDKMEVPYYPLDTVASTEFTYAAGYVITPNAQTLYKEVFVGGIGNGVATPGSGRKYKALQFTAYEIRRQPWLDIQKLSVMAGEQLAIDVRADIIGTQINAANFGNAIWTGPAGGFDHSVLGATLMVAANNAFWPKAGRNVVVTPAYHGNLSIDPSLFPYLYSGNTDILNMGLIQNKYGFENILEDPMLPVANSIRGGDGAVVAGTDPNLAGYMCWPSAVLIATAPIMPPPGVLKKLVAYEQITDDQTGLSFTYQFFGDEVRNRDNEIIECSYGSGLGELKALFRLTSVGN
jgi:ATP-dependent protease ClpP protease subunit